MADLDEATASFNAVTGNDKPDVAKFFLDSSDQNVEVAINMFMESGGAMPGAGQEEEAAVEEEEEEESKPAPNMSVTATGKDDEEQRCVPLTFARLLAL